MHRDSMQALARMPNIRLPDGSSKSFPNPVTAAEVAQSIGAGLARAALAARVNGKLVDLSHRIEADADLAIVTERDPEGVEVLRHSTAHLLAQAVKELFPDAQVTIGPVIENGFYYDFSYKRPFTPDDLSQIEKRMTEIAKKDLPVQRKEMKRDDAVAFFNSIGEKYKAEIIASIPEKETISLYGQGEKGGPGRVPQDARGGREARPPAPGHAARSVPHAGRSAGPGVLASQG